MTEQVAPTTSKESNIVPLPMWYLKYSYGNAIGDRAQCNTRGFDKTGLLCFLMRTLDDPSFVVISIRPVPEGVPLFSVESLQDATPGETAWTDYFKEKLNETI